MTDTTKMIAELEELLAKATPGPWHTKYGTSSIGMGTVLANGDSICQGVDNDDVEFIVAMYNYLPELLRYTKIAIEPCLDCDSLQSDLQDAEGFGSDLVGVLLKHFPAAEADPDYPGEDLYSANEFDRVILSALRELEARAEQMQKERDWLAGKLAIFCQEYPELCQDTDYGKPEYWNARAEFHAQQAAAKRKTEEEV